MHASIHIPIRPPGVTVCAFYFVHVHHAVSVQEGCVLCCQPLLSGLCWALAAVVGVRWDWFLCLCLVCVPVFGVVTFDLNDIYSSCVPEQLLWHRAAWIPVMK
mgnify:CR=1 FL=1